MAMRWAILLFTAVAAAQHCGDKPTPHEPGTVVPYTTHWFHQRLSHFRSSMYYAQTFPQRYLVNDKYFDRQHGVILMYCGNEGSIEQFWNNTAFLFDIAPEMKALVLFPEHRFYGESVPRYYEGDNEGDNLLLDLLTVAEVVADYAVLLDDVKFRWAAEKVPVIAVGGSYGAELAYYMRTRYPNRIAGALAASAPILSVAGVAPNNTFWPTITKVAEHQVTGCNLAIRRGFAHLQWLADTGRYDIISNFFKLCTPMDAAQYDHLIGYISNAWAQMAMCNYPYPTNFLGNLPAWPIKVVCNMAVRAGSPVGALAYSASLFYNGTGTLSCFDIYKEYVYCSDPTGCGTGNDATSWDYQVCTEMVLSAGTNNVTDMFAPLQWTAAMRDEYCRRRYDVDFRTGWLDVEYWTRSIKSTSNVIFSNGLLDPWHLGGVLHNISDSLVAVPIALGAHHLDLRGSNPADPPCVVEARKQEVRYMRQFADEWRQQRN